MKASVQPHLPLNPGILLHVHHPNPYPSCGHPTFPTHDFQSDDLFGQLRIFDEWNGYCLS